MKPELSLAIPIYNEEACIEGTVIDIVQAFDRNNLDYEIVLVNHGSVDNTQNILERLAKNNKRLNVINLAKNLGGAGAGVMYGLSKSHGDYVGFTYADKEILGEDIVKVYNALKNNSVDISKGLRIKRKDGLFRIISSVIFNLYGNIIFNLNTKDVNGYPLFMKKEIYSKLGAKEINYLFTFDFFRRIRKNGCKVIEIPIEHQKRGGGKSFMKPLRIIDMIFKLGDYTIKQWKLK